MSTTSQHRHPWIRRAARAARVLVAGLADAQLSVITGAGHMLPLEAPDDVAGAIIAARLTPAFGDIRDAG